jgi:hypothetical protein
MELLLGDRGCVGAVTNLNLERGEALSLVPTVNVPLMAVNAWCRSGKRFPSQATRQMPAGHRRPPQWIPATVVGMSWAPLGAAAVDDLRAGQAVAFRLCGD